MRSGGGFTQQGGRFYMTTPQQELVLVDPEQPGNSSLLHTFPDSIDQIQGLASFPYACDSVLTYVVTSNYERVTRIYQMDMETYELGPSCELEAYVLDVASDMECLLPPCELYTDLDADDSAGLPGNAYRDTTCTGPVPIADADAEVFSPFVLDSLRIELLSMPDGGDEQLSCPGWPGIGVQGNGSGSLLLVNEGTESGEAFTQALRAAVYENTGATPTLGTREIVVTMYSSFYGSMPSMAEIVLDTINPLTLAQDSASTLCHGQADASVTLQGSGGLAPYRFQWPDGVEDSTRTALAAGSYVIDIADAQGCSGQDTLQIAEPDTLIASVVATDSLTCAGSGQLTTVVQGGVPSYNYVWSDGSTAAAANGLGPGPHTVTVTDQNGCTDTAGFTFDRSRHLPQHHHRHSLRRHPLHLAKPKLHGRHQPLPRLQQPVRLRLHALPGAVLHQPGIGAASAALPRRGLPLRRGIAHRPRHLPGYDTRRPSLRQHRHPAIVLLRAASAATKQQRQPLRGRHGYPGSF